MKVIGLTGGIGSGKSTVANMLCEEFGAYAIYTDDVAKELMKKGEISYRLTVEYFGNDILTEDGEIDRKRLSAVVFADEEKRKKLNSFSHPYVAEFVEKEIARLRKEETYRMVVVETALLIEAGYQKYCDEIWGVLLSPAIRRARLKESRGYTDEKIDSILKTQMTDEFFEKACTHVIHNDGSLEAMRQQIKELVK